VSATTTEDRERFFGQSAATRIHVMEAGWLGRMQGRHARAAIELRITPSIWPFWRQAANSTVGFSGSRLRNSAPHSERFG
jgi:hypothetical protein